ncbi:MAG: 50S ribosomal protein L13 [Thermoplasmata archaeon]|nr:50S ribosomal protein L13 [Thermoplasmata archaeon]
MQVFNAEGMILGRFASHIAKLLIENQKAGKDEEIIVVNAEKAVIVGSKDTILKRYHFLRDVGSQRKGPYFPRMPDRILRRTIRGMIPYQTPKGRTAFKRLKVYLGVPREFNGKQLKAVESARETHAAKKMTLKELSRYLGLTPKYVE